MHLSMNHCDSAYEIEKMRVEGGGGGEGNGREEWEREVLES